MVFKIELNQLSYLLSRKGSLGKYSNYLLNIAEINNMDYKFKKSYL